MNKDFQRFAVKGCGISSNTLHGYENSIVNYVNPHVLEQRSMNVTSLDIMSRLQMDRILFLGDTINSDVANIITAQLLWLEQQSDADICLYINSPGGSVSDGLQIIDTMDFIQPNVSTTCMGLAASMGAVIGAHGTKGKRFITPHGRFMIHQPLMQGGHGSQQASDIQIMAEQILKTKEELYNLLCNDSNLSIEEIVKMGDRDCWLTADEAISYGFIDHKIEKRG